MSDQERRALYFRLTGKLPSTNFRLYDKFCMGFAQGVAAEREKVAHWMITACYATGHGETTEDLLRELAWQMDERIAQAVAAERERICEAIKSEDDYCVDNGDYMLDSDDCIAVARGIWVRPEFNLDDAAIRARGTK